MSDQSDATRVSSEPRTRRWRARRSTEVEPYPSFNKATPKANFLYRPTHCDTAPAPPLREPAVDCCCERGEAIGARPNTSTRIIWIHKRGPQTNMRRVSYRDELRSCLHETACMVHAELRETIATATPSASQHSLIGVFAESSQFTTESNADTGISVERNNTPNTNKDTFHQPRD